MATPKPKFKAGDRVRCISNSDNSGTHKGIGWKKDYEFTITFCRG